MTQPASLFARASPTRSRRPGSVFCRGPARRPWLARSVGGASVASACARSPLAVGDPPGRGQFQASGVLPRRVHVPVQPMRRATPWCPSSPKRTGKGYRHRVTVIQTSKRSAVEVAPRVHLVASLLKRRTSRSRGKLFERLLEQAVACIEDRRTRRATAA